MRYIFNDWAFDEEAGSLLSPLSDVVGLTKQQTALLCLILKEPDRVVSRDDFSKHVKGVPWRYGDRSLDMCVSRLRRILGHETILTVQKAGYRLAEETAVEHQDVSATLPRHWVLGAK